MRRKRTPSQPEYPDQQIRHEGAGAPTIVVVSNAADVVRAAEALRRAGKYDFAEEQFRRGLRLLGERPAPEVLCWGMWGQATSLRNRGKYAASADLYIKTLSVARSSGVLLCERWCLAGLAEIDRMKGLLPQALRSHEELRSVFARDNDARGLGWALSGMAQIQLNLGDTSDAVALFREAAEAAHLVGDRIGGAYALRGQAEVALRRGDMVLASRLSSLARQAFEDISYAVGTAYAIRTMSHVALAEHQAESAAVLALEAMAIFQQLNKPLGIAYMKQTLAAIALDGPPAKSIKDVRSTPGGWLAALPELLVGERQSNMRHTRRPDRGRKPKQAPGLRASDKDDLPS